VRGGVLLRLDHCDLGFEVAVGASSKDDHEYRHQNDRKEEIPEPNLLFPKHHFYLCREHFGKLTGILHL
jgi:hypothetical protein